MRFNASKCHIMNIARGKPVTRMYELCNEFLTTVNSAKYLGVIVSDNLQWEEHINSVTNKANSMLHLVARNLRRCPRMTKVLSHTTLVRPRLEYSCSVWDPYKQGEIDALEMVNRRAARLVYNKSWRQQGVSPTALLEELGWHTLEERRRQQRLAMLYRIENHLIAVQSTRLQRPARQTRGHQHKYQVIATTHDIVKFSFFQRTIRDWNSLPSETVAAPTLGTFKQKFQ